MHASVLWCPGASSKTADTWGTRGRERRTSRRVIQPLASGLLPRLPTDLPYRPPSSSPFYPLQLAMRRTSIPCATATPHGSTTGHLVSPLVYHLQAAYLALTQFLDYNNNLVLLLVNTLLSDPKSETPLIGGGRGRGGRGGLGAAAVSADGPYHGVLPKTLFSWSCDALVPPRPPPRAVNTALVAATKLIGPDLINAVLPVVVERLHHPKVGQGAACRRHWVACMGAAHMPGGWCCSG